MTNHPAPESEREARRDLETLIAIADDANYSSEAVGIAFRYRIEALRAILSRMGGEPVAWRDLLFRIRDYFDLNMRPENDLAQKYVREISTILAASPPTPALDARTVDAASTDEEALALLANVIQRIADTALASFRGDDDDALDESLALSEINNLSRKTIDALLKRTYDAIPSVRADQGK
jgi:hypothetical protein